LSYEVGPFRYADFTRGGLSLIFFFKIKGSRPDRSICNEAISHETGKTAIYSVKIRLLDELEFLKILNFECRLGSNRSDPDPSGRTARAPHVWGDRGEVRRKNREGKGNGEINFFTAKFCVICWLSRSGVNECILDIVMGMIFTRATLC